jgi:hypothetical protein
MRFPSSFCKVTPAAVVLPYLVMVINAQQPSRPQTIMALSEPVRTTLYPEIMCPHCIVPRSWDRDYLLHLEIDKDSALVSMYDRDGKKVLEALFKPSHAVSSSVGAVGATHLGGTLAVGGAILNNGSVRKFIAKTDSAGRVLQLITMGGPFTPRQVCEASDGTIWTLGYDSEPRESPDSAKNVLRHYNEKGLVASFISLDSIGKFPDSISQIANPGRSYLRYGKNRVSAYVGRAAQYIEVDASSGKLARWNVDMSSVVGSKTCGFAVTDEGKVFVAFANDPDSSVERKHGLYELKAISGGPRASLTPVDGTITTFDSSKTVPDGTFLRLWGADGDNPVVSRKGDDSGLSWAKVLVNEN